MLQVDHLRAAIEELYYFEFVLDDIPFWGFVGYIEENGFLPHSHKVNFFTSHCGAAKERIWLRDSVEKKARERENCGSAAAFPAKRPFF